MRREPPARILIADDQADVLEALGLLFRREGFRATTARSPAAVLEALGEREFDCVLADLNYTRDTTSGGEGLGLLARIRRLDPALPVVVMTAWGSVEGAVDAMRAGARDYVEKPWNNARLLSTIRTQVELRRALRKTRLLEDQARRSATADGPALIAGSPVMKPVIRLMERVAPSEANVLVTGEHGTGKEVIARWIHALSGRAEESFVAVNAGGFAEGLFESELFGHVRGAFTDAREDRAGCFELADGGTLFLDEIANVPLGQQSKLLRVIETGELTRLGSAKLLKVDVRIVSATNARIAEAVSRGEFREDLLYRLNTVEIRLPPLRERPEDIPLLARHFLERERRRYGREIEGFDGEALRELARHTWPGNVRELGHAVERAVLLATGNRIRAGDLALRRRRQPTPGLERMTLDEADRYLVRRALERNRGNVSRAAGELGVSRGALYRRMERHGL